MTSGITSRSRLQVPPRQRAAVDLDVARIVTRPTQEEIAARAYDIYVASGSRPGQCLQNWLQAERELLSQGSGAAAASTRRPADEPAYAGALEASV